MPSGRESRRWWRRIDLRLAVVVGAWTAGMNALLVSALTMFAAFEALEEKCHALDSAARRIAVRWPASSTEVADSAFRVRPIEGRGVGAPGPGNVGASYQRATLRAALASRSGDALTKEVSGPNGERLEVVLPLDHFVGERRELLAGAAAVIGLGALASTGLGVVAARRALEPVRTMAGAMRAIAPEALDARIAVRDSGDDLDALAESINAVLGRLEWAFGRLSRFSADVAHELRNAISRLLNETEVILLDAGDSGHVAALASVHATALEMRDVVERLLLLARGEEGRLGHANECVDVGELCARMVEFYRPMAEDLGITMTSHGVAASVRGDRLLLETAVSNLIENALRHTRAGAAIEVVIETHGGRIRLGVLDSGPGIPICDRERIFERFVRLSEGLGSGLGLPIARMIARVHGGDLVADASPLGGAAFWLTLPVADRRLG